MSETGGPQPEPTPGARPAWVPTGATPAGPAPAGATPVPETGPTPTSPTPVPETGPTPTSPTPAAPQDGEAPPADKKPRPAWLLPVAIVAGVVVVGGIVAAIVASQGGDDAAAPAVTATVVAPSPTPTVAPAERPDPTAFTSALPASVMQYAFSTEAPADDWLAADALEAVTDTYTDGGTGTLVVDAGQFATAEQADAFAKTLLTGDGTTNVEAGLPAAGEVTAGGEKVGTFVIQDAGDGTGVAVWTNGTSVFRLTTAVADVTNAYTAFPL